MTQTFQLTEWRSSEPLLLSSVQRRGLEELFQASIRSGPTADTFIVTPGNVVGAVEIGGALVVVSPKIAVDRVVFMISYAQDPYRWREDWASLGRIDDLVEGFAALFLRACDRVLACGLHRAYRSVEADEAQIRGRVRWARQVRRPLPLPIAVRYQTHDDDVLENQLIRAALASLRATNIRNPRVAAELARTWNRFRDLRVLQSPRHELRRLVWTRQNEHYRPLLGLARLIIEGNAADLTGGAVSAPGFTLSMPQVFEQFVRTALREQNGLSLTEMPDDPREHDLHLDSRRRLELRPDLGVRIQGRWCFVGDVKYKRDLGSGRQADLYQLLAYATAARLEEATLIYADGPVDDSSHIVRVTGTRLNLIRLDLTRQPREVLRQLERVKLAPQVLPLIG